MENKYIKGLIYKICVGEELYIGSTIEKLVNRKAKHKYKMKKYPDRNLYKKLIETNTKLELIKIYECEIQSIKDLHIVEEEYRIKYNATLNTQKCNQTEEDRKEYKKEWNKKYREENKEELNKKSRDNHKNNREKYLANNKIPVVCDICGITVSKNWLSRHKKTKSCIKKSI